MFNNYLDRPELRRAIRQPLAEAPAPGQIDAAIAFIMRFAAPGGELRAAPPFDLDVVDEAIVNAVAHRDYSIYGSKIRLFLFADRLEIYSPGKLPNTVTLEAMPYRIFTRNQLLVNFLSHIHSKRTGRVFLESRGEGVRKILEHGEAHSGRRPIYELFGEELRFTLWARMGWLSVRAEASVPHSPVQRPEKPTDNALVDVERIPGLNPAVTAGSGRDVQCGRTECRFGVLFPRSGAVRSGNGPLRRDFKIVKT